MLRLNLYRKEEQECGARGRWLRALLEGPYYHFHSDEYATQGWWVYNPFTEETYQVSLSACSCPDFQYRTSDIGSCKHILELARRISNGNVFEREEMEEVR